jgi:hypothetical protein
VRGREKERERKGGREREREGGRDLYLMEYRLMTTLSM